MRALDKTNLTGLWAAIPTPWKPNGRLDERALFGNCERLAATKVDGIYTTDSDGEFYAIELAGFRRLARVFSRAMERAGLGAQMGVTWFNTQGIIDRIRVACDVGIPNVHVAFPCWMPLTAQDLSRFFEDLASAEPQARWIHYTHPKTGPSLTGKDYARLSRQFPDQLVGTKLTSSNLLELSDILGHAPDLAHFVCDTTMVVGMLLGAKGCYSYWINTLPQWHRTWFDACLKGNWSEAAERHKKLILWELNFIKKIREAGHVVKARVALTGFLKDSGASKPPYYPLPEEEQEKLLRSFNEYWAEELRDEAFSHKADLVSAKLAEPRDSAQRTATAVSKR
ncbi:MAG: dihydrodipicolinate synthase family protein [Verrucomicrobia bacterium]|nr:dihydrodipicolinate synthase family protein [Verrucomicrobiota bacterium]